MEVKLYRLQKILIWIPILNFVVFFLWAWNQFQVTKQFGVLKATVLAAITLIPCLLCITVEINLYQWIITFFEVTEWLLYYIEGLTVGALCLLSQKLELHMYSTNAK